MGIREAIIECFEHFESIGVNDVSLNDNIVPIIQDIVAGEQDSERNRMIVNCEMKAAFRHISDKWYMFLNLLPEGNAQVFFQRRGYEK